MLVAVFWIFRCIQELMETLLSLINRQYFQNPERQKEASDVLGISTSDLEKASSYSKDKQSFGLISSWLSLLAFSIFWYVGGFGLLDDWSLQISHSLWTGSISHALVFFAGLSILSSILSIPLSLYSTFVIEEKHGFNRQTLKGFFGDVLKGAMLGSLLGGLLISGLIWVMDRLGESWWIWAWALVAFFSIFLAWVFPSFLAPLFNKFQPLPEGELKEKIQALAARVEFPAGDVSVMDASKRSSHGNAYFTGVFGKKKIVLFDTLVQAMTPTQVSAVLAHELGHFKLKHVRWSLLRGIAMMGVSFFLLSKALPLLPFYEALGFHQVSYHAALVVFSLWFGLIQFYFQPLSAWMSRRNEFAADRFAKTYESADELVNALLKLRETSHAMPLSHPIYSAFYHSHPPLLERIRVLRSLS
ncbi:MAG: M48 family metallopeptidase [Pseudomonadota bacterium]